MDLQEKVSAFRHQGNLEDLEHILLSCIDEDGEIALDYVLQLVSFKIDSPWIKVQGKYACVLAALYWGEKGLSSLVDVALNSDDSLTVRCIVETLSYAAASALGLVEDSQLGMFGFFDLSKRLDFTNEKYRSDDFVRSAKEGLINVAVNWGSEISAPNILSNSLQKLSFGYSPQSTKAFGLLLAACSNRWLRIDERKLNDYMELLQKPNVSEQEVHMYIVNNPYLLDPFYAHIWSKEPLGEELIADFVVRLMDDNYIAVEIEKPGDPIMTIRGDLSAQATHAIKQVIEYRSWLADNRLYAQQRFENLRRPSCLVVIGMESNLGEKQKRLLAQRNEQGDVKIVGFDWLHQRAQVILDNLVKHGFERYEI